MKVEQANAISLSKILEQMGYLPVKQVEADFWYYSPLTQADIPNFYINNDKNTWHDFTTDHGGKVVDFVCFYLQSQGEDHTIADALRWLKNMQPCASTTALGNASHTYDSMPLALRKIMPLQNPVLLSYLEDQAFFLPAAKQHLKEVIVQHKQTNDEYYALGLPNEDGGFEVFNDTLKGRIAPNGISFIRGEKTLPDTVHVFHSVFDFLAILTYQENNQLGGDIIILNALAFLPLALPYLKGYSYRMIHTWLDNSDRHLKATHVMNDFANRQGNLSLRPMNKVYAGHENVYAWHRHMLNL